MWRESIIRSIGSINICPSSWRVRCLCSRWRGEHRSFLDGTNNMRTKRLRRQFSRCGWLGNDIFLKRKKYIYKNTTQKKTPPYANVLHRKVILIKRFSLSVKFQCHSIRLPLFTAIHSTKKRIVGGYFWQNDTSISLPIIKKSLHHTAIF